MAKKLHNCFFYTVFVLVCEVFNYYKDCGIKLRYALVIAFVKILSVIFVSLKYMLIETSSSFVIGIQMVII